MAREILFKAKRVDNGEWVEGYAFDDGLVDSKRLFVGDLVITDYKGSADDKWNVGINLYEVFPETLCQYTGLIDKNGKKIFDNDIFKHYNRTDFLDFESYETGVVKWDEIKCRYVNYRVGTNEIFNLNCECDYEVICNIFDNPEFLEG